MFLEFEFFANTTFDEILVDMERSLKFSQKIDIS